MIEVWRVGPDDEFWVSQVPGGIPLLGIGARYVAELRGATVGEARYFFGWTAKRAVKKALAYERAVARSKASRQVIETEPGPPPDPTPGIGDIGRPRR